MLCNSDHVLVDNWLQWTDDQLIVSHDGSVTCQLLSANGRAGVLHSDQSWSSMRHVSCGQEECDAINYTINNLYIHKASPWLASSLPHTLCNVNSSEYHVRPSIVILLDLHMYNVIMYGHIENCAGIILTETVCETKDKLISFSTLIFMLPLSSKEKFGFSL